MMMLLLLLVLQLVVAISCGKTIFTFHHRNLNNNNYFDSGEDDHHETRNYNNNEEEDLTRVFDGFVYLNNYYDALVRPGQFDYYYNDGSPPPPTRVKVDVELHPGLQVNEERNEVTVTLTLTQNYSDPRLAYESRVSVPSDLPYVTLPSSGHMLDLWAPDTFIMNQKRVSRLDYPGGSGELVFVDPKGGVSTKQRITVTVHCPFWDNQYFPFDSQVCGLEFSSFAWNTSQLVYEVSSNASCNEDVTSSNNGVFRISNCLLKDTVFSRDEFKLGNSSGFIKEITLERNLSYYVFRMYVPMAIFTLISIVGVIRPVSPELGAGLTYLMFGLMSIFMSIMFKGQDFCWGEGKTALDSYYLYCLLTCALCGIANLLRLQQTPTVSAPRSESFEMSLRNNNSSSCEWSDNNHPHHQFLFNSFLKVVTTSLFTKINESSVRLVVIIIVVFIAWNLVYWIHHL